MAFKQRFFDLILGHEATVHGIGANISMPTNSYDNTPVSVATTSVKILAETMAKMPLNIWTPDKTKGRVKDTKTDLYWLVHSQPNKYTTTNTLIQALEYQRNFKGNAFAEIKRNQGTGKPMHFEILPQRLVKGYKITNGDLYYEVYTGKDNAETRDVNQSDMLHFRMVTKDGIWGINPIEALSLNMGVTHKGLKSMDSFYTNNALSPKALKSVVGAANVGRSKEAISTFQAEYAGSNNAGKWINLPPNVDVVDLAINFADAQIIESLKFNSQQIAALYGVPVYMATGDYEQSKFNNIEQMSLAFKVNTIQAIARMYKAELESKLLTTKERKQGKEIEFNMNVLVEPDTKTKAEYYGKLLQGGVIKPSQVAMFENLEATEDQDILLAQTNLQELSKFKNKDNDS